MNKKVINSENAPDPIGPYNQAIGIGDFIFTSGQIALDANSGELVSGGIEAQTRKVMQNLEAVLLKAGSNWGGVLKTTIYLKNMSDFSAVNEIYGKYFEANAPARSTVEVSRLPKDVLVEIDCIACRLD